MVTEQEVLAKISSMRGAATQFDTSRGVVDNALNAINGEVQNLGTDRYDSAAADQFRIHYADKSQSLRALTANLDTFVQKLRAAAEDIENASQYRAGIDTAEMMTDSPSKLDVFKSLGNGRLYEMSLEERQAYYQELLGNLDGEHEHTRLSLERFRQLKADYEESIAANKGQTQGVQGFINWIAGVKDDYEGILDHQYESLDEINHRIESLESELTLLDEEHAMYTDAMNNDIADAEVRANHIAGAPPTDPSSRGGNTDWRKAWAWANPNGDILDPNAPYSDPDFRTMPGEAQGSNTERIIKYLDVEHNPRYDPSLHNGNTMCTIYVADATRIMNAEIPMQPNRSANAMVQWLQNASANPSSGWKHIDVSEAQNLANQGHPVVATQPGHVAMVRPVPEGGNMDGTNRNPYIAQAGATNRSSTRVSNTFNQPVTYYYHP